MNFRAVGLNGFSRIFVYCLHLLWMEIYENKILIISTPQAMTFK